MRILVTGGAGYIGTSLIAQLQEQTEVEKIIVYDNLSRENRNFFIGRDRLNSKKIHFIQGDLLDSRLLKKVIQEVDVVYHLAAKVTTPFSDQNPHLFEQVNHWGTAELVYAIEDSNVRRLIYLSSVSVYGAADEQFKLTDSPLPKTFYGISKLRGEQHVERLKDKIETYIIRCGNVYGYNKSMRFDAVVNKMMFEANYLKRITINGTGEQFRPFIHIDKASLALTALVNEKLNSGVYNLIDRNMAIGEIVEALRNIYPNLEMIFVNQHMKMRQLKVERSETLNAYWQSNSSLEEELIAFKKAFTF